MKERFTMSQVVRLLHLPEPPSGRSAYYIQCPYCDGNPTKKHLNINLKKEVFRCPKCGISGGIFDLYALYTGVERSKVREELAKELGGYEVQNRKPKYIVFDKEQENILADIKIRHQTYSKLLSKLKLDEDHVDNLLQRGLRIEEIMNLEYKTTPIVGMAGITRQLLEEGCVLKGVPGFYRTVSGDWTFIGENRGILIPVRDWNGQIQGLQIRRDNVTRRKFRWVSSVERKDGCGAMSWPHFVGKMSSSIILTEGPMKADIISMLTGRAVLAVPGVNSLKLLDVVLERLKKEGVKEIKTAFDMDFVNNIHVQKGYHTLLELLSGRGFQFSIYLWDNRYKGLDDYIWECCLKRKRED